MMPLGGEDLGRQSVNEGRVFINGIHVLIKRYKSAGPLSAT